MEKGEKNVKEIESIVDEQKSVENNENFQVESVVGEESIVESVNSKSDQKVWYSGFWVRFAGYIIDYMILSTFTTIIFYCVIFIGVIIFIPLIVDVDDKLSAIVFAGIYILGILSALIVVAAYNIIMVHKYQATVGKIAIGVKVLNEDGTKLSLKQVILRETVGKFISRITLMIGYIMAGFTDKKQALHDKMFHSIVVYENQQKGPNKIAVWMTFGLYGFLTLLSLFFVILIMFASFISEM